MANENGMTDESNERQEDSRPTSEGGITRRSFIRRGVAGAGVAAVAASCFGPSAPADMVPSQDGSVLGFKDTPKLPWAPEYHKHDPDRPWPTDITPGAPCCPDQPAAAPPSDAIMLFDGADTSRFESHAWEVDNGVLVARDASIVTRDSFGDCQLHIEWQAPDPPQGNMSDWGNSGVFFMNRYEIQIFDSHSARLYPDGIAGAVYGETPPMVHPIRPPGHWNVFDITFTAPVFRGDEVSAPATVTMLFNGVLVHHHTTIHGPCAYREILPYSPHPPKQPLMIQEHGNPVRFRNIWIRELDL